MGMELLSSLLQGLKAQCALFPDKRGGRGGNIAMADFGLSAFSLFFMQSESFLSHQLALEKGHTRTNCQTLFGMERIPTDNYIRDNLDPVDPTYIEPLFHRLEEELKAGAMKTAFGRLGGRTLIALDGTEYFCSYKIKCPQCLSRNLTNGETQYYHTLLSATVVAPGTNRVVPLMPEFIARQDGAEKQDCERNAAKRWLDKHSDRVKPLQPVYLGDDLFACYPIAERIFANGDDYIFTCKEGSHKGLYDFISGASPEKHEEKVRKRSSSEIFRYRWIKNVPLRDGKDVMKVNWVGFEIFDAKGKRKYTMAWVTSLAVSKDNVAEIVACGRARWKIENESFNVMKNHGYELEHNFGHGKRFLAMNLAAFNLLAFAWHSILDLLEPPWQAAREAAAKRTRFFTNLVTLTAFLVFPDWQTFLKSLATHEIPDHVRRYAKIPM
jgi:hypothetical protein